MSIPDDIKENVRAVLLSKTDGSGILVSTFLKDYKSIIHKPLMYKDLGYQTLEKFIKDIPDVCRLEYSDQHMAFKLFGISKPNTFVSSFVKKAEGKSSQTEQDSSKKSSNRWEKYMPTEDLNEKWEPSVRGLYSLCFPNRKDNGLTSKEAICMKFAQLGEVVEINSIPSLTFIRYREEKAAKKAIELYGEELRLRRAEERFPKSGSGSTNKNNKKLSSENRGATMGKSSDSHTVNGMGSRITSVNKKAAFDDDECWDDDGDDSQVKKSSPGGYRGSVSESRTWETKQFENHSSHKMHSRGDADSDTSNKDRPSGTRDSKISDNQLSPVQVYIGNWPNEADENDLRSLLSPYNCITCRIVQSKESKNKKFAFADLYNERDAQKLISDMNNTVFKNRDLKCRLGKKKGDRTNHNDDTHRDGTGKTGNNTQQKYQQSPKSNYSPNQNTSIPLLETPVTPHSRMQKNQQSPKSNYSPNQNTNIPLLETPVTHHSRMQKNQHSPKSNYSPKLNTSMPLLESNVSPRGRMPPLEHLSDEMPPLEPVLSPVIPVTQNMPVLEDISPIKPLTNGEPQDNSYTPVQLNVGNFPYGTTEYELMQILGMYGAQSITIMNNDMTSRSTYAFADFCNVDYAMVAMDNLDQSQFKGRKLVVTLSNPGAVFQKQNISQVSSNTNHVPNFSYPAIDKLHLSPVSMSSEKSSKRSQQQNRSNFNFQRLTNLLQDYTKISTKLRADDQFQCMDGMLLTVMITHVENEKFFWAQILQDSVNGDNLELHHLESLASQLQLEPKVAPINGLGRCIAKYENEWFRAWCTYETHKNGEEMGELLFIDYGNTTFCRKSEMFRAKSQFWTLPPMAKPFKLNDFKPDLDNCLNKVAKLEVMDSGTPRTNSVTTVRALHWV